MYNAKVAPPEHPKQITANQSNSLGHAKVTGNVTAPDPRQLHNTRVEKDMPNKYVTENQSTRHQSNW